MSALDKSQFQTVVQIGLGSPSASASYPGPKLPENAKLKTIRFYNGGVIAADPLVNAVIEVKSGSTVLASFSSEDDGFAAEWLDAEIAEQELAAGAQLSVVVTLTGDPDADPDPIVAPPLTKASVELCWHNV